MNNSGQVSLTKTGILFVVIVFYASLFTLIGLLNSFMATNVDTTTEATTDITLFDFFGSIITGISMIPTAINVILFGSLITIISWILVSSLPTMSGGS